MPSGHNDARSDRLRVGCTPFADESLPGLSIRVAGRARLSSAGHLMAMAGLRQPGSVVTSACYVRLADNIGVPVAVLEGQSYRPTGRLAHCQYAEGEVHREFLDLGRRRLCPACLAEKPYHRTAWDLGLTTACPDHKLRLISRCPACRRDIEWRHSMIARCRCAADLTTATPVPVTEAEADANAAVIALARGQEVPWLAGPLARCGRADLIKVAMCLGMFMVDWRGQRRVEALVASGPDKTAEVMIAGVQCLRDWPVSLHAYLDRSRQDEASRSGRYGARKALGGFYDWLHVLEHTATRDVVIAAAKDFIGSDPALASRSHRSTMVGPVGGRSTTGVMSLKEAANKLGRSGQGVRRLMTAGMLPQAALDGRGVPAALDRAAVEALAEKVQGWLTMRDLAMVLGVSRKRATRIVDAGLIRPVHAGPGDGWAVWSFDAREVDGFLDRLGTIKPGGTADVGFNHVVEAFRRRDVDIEGVLERVLNGRLAVRGIVPDEVGLKRMGFCRSEVRGVCRMLEANSGGLLTIQAAAERLGLKWQVVAHLVRHGLLKQEVLGISVEETDRFRREHIYGRELQKCVATAPRMFAGEQAAQGTLPVAGPQVDGCRQNIFRRFEVCGAGRHEGPAQTSKSFPGYVPGEQSGS